MNFPITFRELIFWRLSARANSAFVGNLFVFDTFFSTMMVISMSPSFVFSRVAFMQSLLDVVPFDLGHVAVNFSTFVVVNGRASVVVCHVGVALSRL